MARYSLLEKLAGHAEPEVDGTAIVKLAQAYGNNEPSVDGTAIVKLAAAYGKAEPEFDGMAIVKLAEAYGHTKKASLREKMLGLTKSAEEKPSKAKKYGKAALIAALLAGGAGAVHAASKDRQMSLGDMAKELERRAREAEGKAESSANAIKEKAGAAADSIKEKGSSILDSIKNMGS